MPQAEENKTVRVHYTGKLPDGTIFDSSRNDKPLEFQMGQGQVIAGLEEAVVGMSPGDKRTVTVPPEKAYGQRQEEMAISVSKDEFPNGLKPEVGQRIQVRTSGGQTVLLSVSDVTKTEVRLDANHPLAGKTLTFEIELLEVQ